MADEIEIDDTPDAPKHKGGWPKGRPRTLRTEAPTASADDVRPELRSRKRKGGQSVDQFAVPPEIIPKGQSWEWKRETAAGQGSVQYDVMLREQGWLPVDGAHYPQLVGEGHIGPIRRDGLILMERPIELTREAMEEDYRNAKQVVMDKEAQIGNAPNGQLPRQRADGTPTSTIRTTIESGMPIDA